MMIRRSLTALASISLLALAACTTPKASGDAGATEAAYSADDPLRAPMHGWVESN